MNITMSWKNGAFVLLPSASWEDAANLVEQYGPPDTVEVDAKSYHSGPQTEVAISGLFGSARKEYEMKSQALDNASERKRLAESEQRAAELEHYFDLRLAADMRAVKRWQEAAPGRELSIPDHADIVLFLLEELDRVEGAARQALDRLGVKENPDDAGGPVQTLANAATSRLDLFDEPRFERWVRWGYQARSWAEQKELRMRLEAERKYHELVGDLPIPGEPLVEFEWMTEQGLMQVRVTSRKLHEAIKSHRWPLAVVCLKQRHDEKDFSLCQELLDCERENVGSDLTCEKMLPIAQTGQQAGKFGGTKQQELADAILALHTRIRELERADEPVVRFSWGITSVEVASQKLWDAMKSYGRPTGTFCLRQNAYQTNWEV